MTASARKNVKRADWHPADIKAGLAKKGFTFARIARENGFALTSPNRVLHKNWSQMELIVAGIIGVQPAAIWPSRYDRHGRPLRSGTARVRTKGAGRLPDLKTVSNG
jgi:Ner family transcriptional regulator